MRYTEEMRLQQARQMDEQRMFEQLSAQAREVVSYHEQSTMAREEQYAAHHAREAMAHVWQEVTTDPVDAEARAARQQEQDGHQRSESRIGNYDSPAHTAGTTGATGSWEVPPNCRGQC